MRNIIATILIFTAALVTLDVSAQTPGNELGFTNPSPATLLIGASGPNWIIPTFTYQMINGASNIFNLYSTTNTWTNIVSAGLTNNSSLMENVYQWDDVGLSLNVIPNITNAFTVTVALSKTYDGGMSYETTPSLIWTSAGYFNTTNTLTVGTNLNTYLQGATGFQVDYMVMTETVGSANMTNMVSLCANLKTPKYGWFQTTY